MSQIEEDIDEQPGVVARAPAANAEGLDEACSLIGRARAVRFLAIGSSRHAAGYGAAAVDHLAGVPSGVLAAPGWGTPPPPVADPCDTENPPGGARRPHSGSTPSVPSKPRAPGAEMPH